jgi:hypothetical protein
MRIDLEIHRDILAAHRWDILQWTEEATQINIAFVSGFNPLHFDT